MLRTDSRGQEGKEGGELGVCSDDPGKDDGGLEQSGGSGELGETHSLRLDKD